MTLKPRLGHSRSFGLLTAIDCIKSFLAALYIAEENYDAPPDSLVGWGGMQNENGDTPSLFSTPRCRRVDNYGNLLQKFLRMSLDGN